MSTMMDLPYGETEFFHTAITRDQHLDDEQDIWNIRPKEPSGYNTPTTQLFFSPGTSTNELCRPMEETKKCYPEVSLEYMVAVEMCRKKFVEFFHEDEGALLEIHLGWLASVMCRNITYSESCINRNCNGFLERFHAQFPIISYADLYQLANHVAVTFYGLRDVSFDLFHPGRKDKDESSNSKEGVLPDAAFGNVFPKTRQLSDKEFLIFFGGRYSLLGANDDDGAGIVKPRTSNPRIDNSYYKELSSKRKEGHSLSEMDKFFLDDPVLHFLVVKYAADQHAYLADYARAFMNLSEFRFADA